MIVPHLETVLCDSHVARELAYRLRYRVFCEESGFEDAERFPDGVETDEYDRASAHFLMLDRLNKRWGGALRLIRGNRTARYPLEKLCRAKVYGLDSSRTQSVELSRLAVVRACVDTDPRIVYQKDRQTFISTSEVIGPSFAQDRNETLVRMIWAALQWTKDNDVHQIYGLSTAPMIRMLRRLGIRGTAVGTEIRFRGLRRPYKYDVLQSRVGMRTALPQFGHVLKSDNAYIPFSELDRAYRNAGTQIPLPVARPAAPTRSVA